MNKVQLSIVAKMCKMYMTKQRIPFTEEEQLHLYKEVMEAREWRKSIKTH